MIRLGLAGIGAIAQEYMGLIHSGMVNDVQITALSSRNPANLATAVQTYHLEGVRTFTEYSTMLTSGLIDAVLICTPHQEHPVMAHQAIDHGLHVLVEKPIGVDPVAVRNLVTHLEAKPGLVGGVMYNRRHSSTYRRVHQLLVRKAIGDLVRVTWLITNLYRTPAYYSSSPWRGTWQGEGGGLLMTQASHQLDLLQWLCGMPQAVQAFCQTAERAIDVENEAVLFLRYAGQAQGQFIASAHETPGTNRLEICGTGGQIVVENDSLVRISTLSMDERDFARESTSPFGQPDFSTIEYVHQDKDNRIQHAATIQNFVDTCLGRAEITCSLADAANSLAIIQAAYLSNWNGQQISIPAPEQAFRQALAARYKEDGHS